MTQTQAQTQTRDLEAADYHKGELQGRSGRAEAASGPGAPLQLCESASAAPDPTPALALFVQATWSSWRSSPRLETTTRRRSPVSCWTSGFPRDSNEIIWQRQDLGVTEQHR